MVIKKRAAASLLQRIVFVIAVFLIMFAILAVPFYNSYKQKKAVTTYHALYSVLQQANKIYSLTNSVNMNEYDTTLPINKFAETYFMPYLEISGFCKGSQNQCWKTPQYTDLKNRKIFNKALYSIILSDNTVIGFNKTKNGLISMIVDVDGPSGVNKLGRDVFVFSFYNNNNRPKICDVSEYEKYNIPNGIHFGGYDKCGIPQDMYSYFDIVNNKIADGCSKKTAASENGLGAGAACGALLNKSNWVMDKNYPW